MKNKKFWLFFLTLIWSIAVVSCDCNVCNDKAQGVSVINDGEGLIEVPYLTINNAQQYYSVRDPIRIIEVDSCEYLLLIVSDKWKFTHKGNCRFCEEKNKQIVKDAVKEVFEKAHEDELEKLFKSLGY